MPTIRMTMSSSTSVKPSSARLPPKTDLRLPITIAAPPPPDMCLHCTDASRSRHAPRSPYRGHHVNVKTTRWRDRTDPATEWSRSHRPEAAVVSRSAHARRCRAASGTAPQAGSKLSQQSCPAVELAGGVELLTSHFSTTPVAVPNIDSDMPAALPPTPETDTCPSSCGGLLVVTVNWAVGMFHRPSYVLNVVVSMPTRWATSLRTQLPPAPFTCTQPDKAVRAEPARALASASRASRV